MRRSFFAVIALLAFFVLTPAAHAVSFGPHIATYGVTMTIRSNGLLDVHEDILYDFSVVPRHGIFRDIPVRETYDSKHDRSYKITNVRVGSEAGVSHQTKATTKGNYLDLRVGDPDKTITGAHRYTIDYTVKGALITFPDHIELNWDAIGNQWAVPIDQATVAVVAPATIQKVACYAGYQGSHSGCDSAHKSGTKAAFGQNDLPPNSGVTVVIALPSGSIVPAPKPILEERRTLATAFAFRPNTVGPAGLVLILGLGAIIVFAWRKGRDRRFSGSATDAAFGNDGGQEERVGLGGMDAGPVEFVPPDNVRPGQVGTLIDEEANLIDVTATIIDLAVRGWLTISEAGPKDYELAATAKAGKGTLLPYETSLMNALFKGDHSSVTLSGLKYTFRADLARIQDALYNDMVAQGWYHTRPDRTRSVWAGAGLLATVLAIGLTVLVALKTSFGLVALALVVLGIALLVAAHRMPARTPKGSAMYSRVKGFRRLFDEGDEGLRARFAEDHSIFSQYLPYAIVFGCAKKWAHAFEGLAADDVGATSWYHGTTAFDAVLLASSIDHFGTIATGTMYASQPSSSSSSGFSSGGGFSGGGGGGGGGGSW